MALISFKSRYAVYMLTHGGANVSLEPQPLAATCHSLTQESTISKGK